MKMKEVYALADQLFTSPTAVGVVQRRQKSPRFAVGYIDLGTGRARTVGASDVDWESAFYLAQRPHRGS